MKTKKFSIVAIIAILLVVVIALSWFINELGFSLKAYADSVSEPVGVEYFSDMWGKAKYDEALTKEEKTALFETLEFQRNKENFELICAEEIAEITDERYGVNLGYEADKVSLSKDKDDNVIGPKITDESTLTVFTYGQGSALQHWSNAGGLKEAEFKKYLSEQELKDYEDVTVKEENKISPFNVFAYKEDSMIELLRRQADADVYVAQTLAFDINNSTSFDFTVAKHKKDPDDKNGIAPLILYKLEPNWESYKGVRLKKAEYQVSKIEDMTKHNIIIFNTNTPSTYHNYVYNELNIVLTQILYDYLLNIGQVPKVSMISHSTGGVWNMMWANKHPLNVDSLFALAAPFNGSTTGHFLHFDWEKMAQSLLGGVLDDLHGAVTNPSGMNNVDKERYYKLHDDWNEAVKINPELRCYAFTGLMSADLVEDMLIPGISGGVVGKSYILQLLLVTLIAKLAVVVLDLVLVGTICLTSIFAGGVGVVALTVALAGISAYLLKELYDIIDAFGGVGKYALENLTIDQNGELCLMDDGLVDYNSALGYKPILDVEEGEDRRTEWYSNFVRFEKTFRPDNSDPINKKTTPNIAVPHNLETMDADIISHVAENIEMEEPSEIRYDYTILEDSTINITGIHSDEYNKDCIVIPDYIEGRQVSRIDDSISVDQKEEIEFIEIGKFVTYVGDNAFDGAAKLYKLNLNDGLQVIGQSAFQGASIETLSLPNSIEEIGSNAFANTKLKYVNALSGNDVRSLNNLHFVGEHAFQNTAYIDDATDNVVIGRVLIHYKSYSTELKLLADDNIKYFAQKCFEGSNLQRLDVSAFKFEDNILPDQFVYGAENLKEVFLPNNIVVIGLEAFAFTPSLKALTMPHSVEVIGVKAFSNSGIQDLTLDTPYPPIISKEDTFEDCLNMNVWVKHYAQDDFRDSWCDSTNPFALNDDTIKVFSASLNFYDDGVLVFSEDNIYYYDYLENYSWMQENGYTKAGNYFLGWFDKHGKQYYAGSLLEFDINEEWALYANWQINEYYVWYENYDGDHDNLNAITINDTYYLMPCQKDGYIFNGWYDSADFNGAKIEILKDISQDIKLYANFEPIDIVVKYYVDGINVERQSDTFKFGERFFAPIPERIGYAFAGWYTTPSDDVLKGERITGINGVSLKKCSFLETVTLYARWTAKSFVIEYNDGINSFVLRDGELTTDAGSVLFGQQIDVNKKEFGYLFKRQGYIFKNFVDQNGQDLDFTGGVRDLGKNFSTFVISPVLIPEQYEFILYDGFGNYYRTVSNCYDEIYDFSISHAGYDFAGWADKTGKIILDEMTGVLVVDFTPNVESNGIAELYAVWTPSKGNITFDSTGGSKVELEDDYLSVYNAHLPNISIPYRNGYNFLGFYDEKGNQYINNKGYGVKNWDKTESFVTLYAEWGLQTYTLYYDYQDHMGKVATSTFTVENLVTFPTTGFNKVGYTFVGWCTDKSGINRISNTKGIYSDLYVYAKWSENTYTIANSAYITVNNNNCSINLSKISNHYSYRIITLSSSVNDILISNSTSVNIVIICKAANLNLYLRNAEFKGLAGYSTISGQNINIVVVGNSSITGADGISGSVGTQGDSSYNHGSPSNGSPKAGDGSNGGVGGRGNDGQVAIYASTVSIVGKAYLTVQGGNGGNGGQGGNGGNGAYGNDGCTGGGKDNGVTGGNGGNGGRGGDGGNGAYAISATTINNQIKNSLILKGGNGGNAGTGGNGGNGGHGGKGANNPGFLFFTSNFAGKGGNGGNGGDGGYAGAKGSGRNATPIYVNGAISSAGKEGNKASTSLGGKLGTKGHGGDGPIGGANGADGKNGLNREP